MPEGAAAMAERKHPRVRISRNIGLMVIGLPPRHFDF
jgi:hypothetical protein